jgi:GntR family transcriptional regulator
MFILQPNSTVPIYRQLIEQVRRLIAAGQLTPGMELPSVRELAQVHTIHPMTISKAYSQLEAEGLLERRRGKPMTVAPLTRGQSSRGARLKQLRESVDALVFSARQLELDERDVAGLLHERWEQADD